MILITDLKLNEICAGHFYFSQWVTGYVYYFNMKYILELLLLTVSLLDYCLSLHCEYNQGWRPPI